MNFSTDFTTQQYPSIAKAFLIMSYDNGGINRDRTEEDALDDMETMLIAEEWDESELEQLNKMLASLDEDELDLVCSGEESEAHNLMREKFGSILFTRLEQLLCDLFECC